MELLTIIITWFIETVINLIIFYHILIKPLEKKLNIIEEKLNQLINNKEEK